MTTPFLQRCTAAQGDWLDALSLLREVLGENCAERWLARVHYEPLKLLRVLREVRAELREGKQIRNKEAYANDLWHRFL